MKNIPNLLSASRILGAIIFSVLFSYDAPHFFSWAIFVLLIALATDFLDGYLARKFHVVSNVGYILDGLGDRAFTIAIILAFNRSGIIFEPLATILIFREVAIYAIRLMNDRNLEKSFKDLRWLTLVHMVLFRCTTALVLLFLFGIFSAPEALIYLANIGYALAAVFGVTGLFFLYVKS